MHNNDKAQLEQWYNDLTARLAKTHQHSHSAEVHTLMEKITHIGAVLDKELPVIDFRKLFNRRKR